MAEMKLRKAGDVIAWRGIFRGRPWHVHSVIVVSDSPTEHAVVLVPGAESLVEPSYIKGKQTARRWWSFLEDDWTLEKYRWQTNRVLALTEPGKYYSTLFFWNHESDEFICYYINFQLPFVRSRCGIDSLDLDLDLVVFPDFTYVWKDEEDYKSAVEHGAITPEWVAAIDEAKLEILRRIDLRGYPFDGSWLKWKPDPSWTPPTLPAGWEKIQESYDEK